MACLSVNCVAVLLAVCMIVLSSGVLVGVTTSFSVSAADQYARQLTGAVVDGGRNRIADYLGVAVTTEQAVSVGFQSGAFTDFYLNRSRGEAQKVFLRALSALSVATDFKMTSIGAGFADGLWTYCSVTAAVNRTVFCEMTDPHLLVWARESPTANFSWMKTRTRVDFNNGSYLGVVMQNSTYDPRTRGWYTSVNASGPTSTVRFTDVYLHFFEDVPIISIDAPIVNQTTGALYGVSLISIDLQDLSDFLHALPSTAGSATALIDNDGLLLGIADRSPLFEIFPKATVAPADVPRARFDVCTTAASGNIVCRFGPRTCSVAILRDLHAARPDLLRSIAAGSLAPGASLAAAVERVQVGGKAVYVGHSPVAAYTNLRWRLVTVVPDEDITGEITKGRNLAIILAAVVVVVASALCGVALWLLLRPLRAIARMMYEAATLKSDDGSNGAVGSRMAEIRTIEDAFNTLFGQLMKARSFLPAALLAQLDASNDPEDLEDASEAEPSVASAGMDRHSSVQHTPSTHGGDSASVTTGSVRSSHLHSSCKQGVVASAAPRDAHSQSSVMPVHLRGAMIADTFGATGVRTKAVTVLCFNLVGFHDKMRADGGSSTLGAGYAALVDAVSDAAKARRGVLDMFHGDRFTITFNAAIPCATHAASALTVAAALAGLAPQPSTAGVASGTAQVGTTGSSRARRFATVGPVFSQATALERLAKTLPAPTALLTKAVSDETQHTARSVLVDVVPLPGAVITAQTASGRGPALLPVASLVELQQRAGHDEWMYELAAAATGSGVGALTALNQALLDAARLWLDPSLASAAGGISPAAADIAAQLPAIRAQLGASLLQCPDVSYAVARVEHFIASATTNTQTTVPFTDLGRFYTECVLGSKLPHLLGQQHASTKNE